MNRSFSNKYFSRDEFIVINLYFDHKNKIATIHIASFGDENKRDDYMYNLEAYGEDSDIFIKCSYKEVDSKVEMLRSMINPNYEIKIEDNR